MATPRKINVSDDWRPADPRADLYGFLEAKPHRDQLLCAAVLHRALQFMHVEGHWVAPEMVGAIHRAAMIQYEHLPQRLKEKLLLVMPAHVDNVLKACKVDDARKALLAASLAVLKATEEGYVVDKGSMSVLTAMAFVEEAKIEPHEWRYNEREANDAANRLYAAAELLGYW